MSATAALPGTIVLLVGLAGAVVAFVRLSQGGQLLATPAFCFVAQQALFLLGSVVAVDWNEGFDRNYVPLTVVGLLVFVAGTAMTNVAVRFRPRREIIEFRSAPTFDNMRGQRKLVFVLTAAVCVAIAIWFVARVGYNAFVVAIQQYATSGELDRAGFLERRQGATRGAYVAAGYAAQFTAVILPAIAVLLYFHGRQTGNRTARWWSLGLTLVSLYAVTAVGGRKYVLQIIVAFILVAASATSPFRRSERPHRRSIRVLVVGTVVLYGAATLLQGRADDTAPTSVTVDAVANAFNRMSGEYSGNQLVAMRALDAESPVWGREWRNTAAIALPGPSVSTQIRFEQRVHGIINGGNTRGNSPLNVWGSAYYNWGPLGMLVMAFLLGMALQYFAVKYIVRRPKTLSRVVLFSLAGYRLALVRDPYSLMLEGGLTLLALYWVERRSTEVMVGDQANLGTTAGRRHAVRRARVPEPR